MLTYSRNDLWTPNGSWANVHRKQKDHEENKSIFLIRMSILSYILFQIRLLCRELKLEQYGVYERLSVSTLFWAWNKCIPARNLNKLLLIKFIFQDRTWEQNLFSLETCQLQLTTFKHTLFSLNSAEFLWWKLRIWWQKTINRNFK